MTTRRLYTPDCFAPVAAGRTVSAPRAANEPDGFLRLPNGARLAFDNYGDPRGFPLLYFHDAGSSRLEASLLHQGARRCGYRLVALDRPGVGCSDFFACKSPRSLCENLLPALEQLDIGRFGVVAKSGGGIYALHLCRMSPDRVVAQASLAGIPVRALASPGGACALLAGIVPPALDRLLRLKQFLFPDEPGALLDKLREELSFSDKKVLSRPEIANILEADQAESVRAGYRGMAQDLAVSFRKLEFPLEEVAVPTEIWRGCADRLTLRADCEYLAARLPRARLHRASRRGHFFFVHHMDQIFGSLRRDWREPSSVVQGSSDQVRASLRHMDVPPDSMA